MGTRAGTLAWPLLLERIEAATPALHALHA
jgi:hypothetical protein